MKVLFFPSKITKIDSRFAVKALNKRHYDVLLCLQDNSNDFSQRNFTFTSYLDNQGKYHHLYELTRDKFFIRVLDTKI